MDWRSLLSAKVGMPVDWIIYAAFGVLVCLLLWRVATQWNVNGAEAGNLRASLVILGVVALAFVVWQGVRLLAVGATTAHTEDKTITVFAAASLTNALDDVDTAFTLIWVRERESHNSVVTTRIASQRRNRPAKE